MVITSALEMAQAIEHLGLLDSKKLSELKSQVLPQSGDITALAKEIARRGWLTCYQLNRLANNNGHRLFFGPYLIIDRLGAGGMGKVYKARHQVLHRVAALKVIKPERLENPAAVERFFREVRAAAQVSSPYIVQAYDAGTVEETHYLAMEYVQGVDLSRRVRGTGPLPIDLACRVMRQAALGLQHAFDRGLVHRDIKPSNLLLIKRNPSARSAQAHSSSFPGDNAVLVKILDLGLARFETLDQSGKELGSLTQAQSVLGTPDFISPEQARNSRTADIRSDLYSLGCTFYFILTGQVPFPGDAPMEKLLNHWLEEPKPLRELRPEVPDAVSQIVSRLMAKNPAERYQIPGHLVNAFDEFLQASSAQQDSTLIDTEASMALPGNQRGTSTLVDTHCDSSTWNHPIVLGPATVTNRTPEERRRWMWINIGGGCLLALFVFSLIALLWRQYGAKPADPEGDSASVKVSQAEVAYQELVDQWQVEEIDLPTKLRALRAFRIQYAGFPEAIRAAEEIVKSPSPLDRLNPGAIPAAWRPPWQTPELVCVLGPQAGPPAPLDPKNPQGPKKASVIPWTNGVFLAFTPDCQSLIAATTNSAGKLWDLATDKERPFLKGHGQSPRHLAVSPDGRGVATAGDDRIVHFCSLETGEELFVPVKKHNAAVTVLGFTPTGRFLVSGSSDGHLIVWDAETGRDRFSFRAHTDAVTALAFSPNGRILITGSKDRSIRLWDLGAALKRLGTLDGHAGAITALAISEDSHVLYSSAQDGTVRIWDWEESKPKGVWHQGPGYLSFLALTLDGKKLVGAGLDGRVLVWDASDTHLLGTWTISGGISAFALAPDGRHAAIAANGSGYIFRLPGK